MTNPDDGPITARVARGARQARPEPDAGDPSNPASDAATEEMAAYGPATSGDDRDARARPTQQARARVVVPVVVLALVAVIALAAQSEFGQTLLVGAGLVAPPEQPVQLAFPAPGRLPLRVDRGLTPIQLSFGVQAHHVVSWTVEVSNGDGSSRVVQSGMTSGDPTFAQPQTARFVLPCAPPRSHVTVHIAASPATIGFWSYCA